MSPALTLPDDGFCNFASEVLCVLVDPSEAVADSDEESIETVAEDCRVLSNALYLLMLGGFVTVEKIRESVELARSLR